MSLASYILYYYATAWLWGSFTWGVRVALEIYVGTLSKSDPISLSGGGAIQEVHIIILTVTHLY